MIITRFVAFSRYSTMDGWYCSQNGGLFFYITPALSYEYHFAFCMLNEKKKTKMPGRNIAWIRCEFKWCTNLRAHTQMTISIFAYFLHKIGPTQLNSRAKHHNLQISRKLFAIHRRSDHHTHRYVCVRNLFTETALYITRDGHKHFCYP